METLKGWVSNLRRDVRVTEPSYSNTGHQGFTSDITNFDLGGRAMQYSSKRSTYDSIGEGDELIVAGKTKQAVFEVVAFRNLTRNMDSYKSKNPPIFLLVAIGDFMLGIVLAIVMFVATKSIVLPVAILLMFLASSCFLLYFEYKRRDAVRSIERFR